MFDSWQGFIRAGFASIREDVLRLGDGGIFYKVTRRGKRLDVHFESGVNVCGNVNFTFPSVTEDCWQWAALLAYGTIESRARWEHLQKLLGTRIPEKMREVIEFGLKHLGELSILHKELIVENDIASVCESMLNCLTAMRDRAKRKQELAKQNGNRKETKALADKIKAIDEELGYLAQIFGTIASESSEESGGGTIILPEKPTGIKSNRTNFAVTFAEDGLRIAEDTASRTLALTIEKIGAKRVADLGLQMEGDPLVTRDKAQIKKCPKAVLPIAQGTWFVKTHSSTITKMRTIKDIAESLSIALTFEYFYCPGKGEEKQHKPPRKAPTLVLEAESPHPSLFDNLDLFA